jgi:poly(3-hydroxybutyrate) depolymerase
MKKLIAVVTLVFLSLSVFAVDKTIDVSVPPGNNYDKAEFRLWYQEDITAKGILALVPGSNGDGRGDVEDTFWQDFAKQNHFALLGCRFTDKQHDNMDIEEYIDVKRGSGDAFLKAITLVAYKAHHAELANAPLLLWGFSAGGEFDYEFACWKPERVIAFVVNKGGVYYSALAPAATRATPGLLFTGEKDLETRTNIIKGIFDMNRRFGAIWAYGNEPGMKHEIGKTRQLAAQFFNTITRMRMDAKADKLKTVDAASGYYGDAKTLQYNPVAGSKGYLMSWLPDKAFADNWLLFVQGKL